MEVKSHSALGIKRRVPESSMWVTKGFFCALFKIGLGLKVWINFN